MKIPKEHAIRLKRLTESVISEGKHWPEDYIKTAFNTIKNSELGKQSWYTDDYIHQDLKSIVDEFVTDYLFFMSNFVQFFLILYLFFCILCGVNN